MSRHKNIWGMSVCSIFFVEQNIKVMLTTHLILLMNWKTPL